MAKPSVKAEDTSSSLSNPLSPPPSQSALPSATTPKKRGRPAKLARTSPAPSVPSLSSTLAPSSSTSTTDNDDSHHPRKKRFMLHRSLPTMDLFTSAAPLSTEELASLSNVNDTDVIAVLPVDGDSQEGEEGKPAIAKPKVEVPVPTLADVNPKPLVVGTPSVRAGGIGIPPPPGGAAGFPRALAPPKPSPVTLLYYDPFSSFAPTFDSSFATTSYHQTTSHKLDRLKIKRHEQEEFSLPPPSSACASSPTSIPQSAVESELRALGLADSEIAIAIECFQSGEVWDKLDENARQLGILQKAQWERLRKGAEATIVEVENTTAKALATSLANLISPLPPSTFLPPPSILEEAIPQLLGAVSRDPSYIGTLDVNNARAVRESGMRKGPGRR